MDTFPRISVWFVPVIIGEIETPRMISTGLVPGIKSQPCDLR